MAMRWVRGGGDAINVGSNCPVVVELEFVDVYVCICEDYKTHSMRTLTSIILLVFKRTSQNLNENC